MATAAQAQTFVPGVVKREFFPNTTRAQVSSTNPPAPASTNFYSSWNVTDPVEGATSRFSGLVSPTTSGVFDFFLAADDDTVTASITTLVTREPFEARTGSEIQRVLIEAIEAERGAKPALIGAPYWTDAALIAAAGIPTLLFGPTGGGIHQPDEWVDLESVNEMARVLDRVIGEFCA